MNRGGGVRVASTFFPQISLASAWLHPTPAANSNIKLAQPCGLYTVPSPWHQHQSLLRLISQVLILRIYRWPSPISSSRRSRDRLSRQGQILREKIPSDCKECNG